MAIHQTEKGSRIGVLSAIGGGLITGLSVGLATLNLQIAFDASAKYATWRADVEAAESIPGCSPGNRDIHGINFSGNTLRDAVFTNVDLRGAQFRDTILKGAVFDGADLRGANFVGADLEASSLGKAFRGIGECAHVLAQGDRPPDTRRSGGTGLHKQRRRPDHCAAGREGRRNQGWGGRSSLPFGGAMTPRDEADRQRRPGHRPPGVPAFRRCTGRHVHWGESDRTEVVARCVGPPREVPRGAS
ncbi:pentapeptide repeat-containing protein [Streptomyces sp. MMS24-I31]|uniref:pentapeptide repeat-containing protein n=1 Tax=Streptomyces sp. MMS24-I31 TaxID=3351563 RepID=UPI0038968687